MSRNCLYLNLDFMPPTAELLCRLPERALENGFDTISFSIIDNFPWSFESRLQSGSAYTDGTLDYFFRSCRRNNITLNYLFPKQGDFVSLLKLNGYRRMSVDSEDIFLINPKAVGFGKFIESILDDVLSLCSDLESFMIIGDEDDYNRGVAEVVRGAGYRVELIKDFQGYDFTHDSLGGGISPLNTAYMELLRREAEFYKLSRAVRQKIVMLSLGSMACSSGGRGIGSDYSELSSSMGMLLKHAEGFGETAKGQVEPIWLNIYMKSIILSAEEEFNSIRNRLKQVSVLY